MRMRSTVFFMALATTVAFAAGQNGPGVELAGDWKTSLEVNGTTLRMLMHVAKTESGLSATLDSLDQGALGLRVDSIRMEGPRLRLEMSQFGARYEGDWNTTANQFEGQWKQGSAAFPLTWKRAPGLANASQGLSEEDRKFLLDYLKKTRDGVLQSIAGLSQAQWTYKPDPSRWSAAECVEHLVIEEHTLFAAITQQVVKIPIPDGQARAAREQDERIIQFMMDRSKKVNAGEAVRPHGKLATPAEGIEQFSKARKESIEWVRATQLDLRGFGTANSTFKSLDAYQYFILMAAHSARHTEQIEEVLRSGETVAR
jgi:hypothetical protein